VKPAPEELERTLRARHREVRLVTSFVILALAGGFAMLWPSVQAAAVARFGPFFPSRVLGGELLALVVLFVIYLWRKTGQIEELIERLVSERGRGAHLEELLGQARVVLEASVQLNLDEDASASLQKILHCVTEALRADRGVLFRQRVEGRPPDREAVFPSTSSAPDPLALAFEDEVARKTIASGTTFVFDEETDLKEIGLLTPRPRKGWEKLVAAPLLVDGAAVGVLLLCNPDVGPIEPAREGEPVKFGLLEVFVGFAAGVLRNLRVFQTIARRNEELERTRELLCESQRELAEIDAVSTMARVAKSLAHGLSDPLTAIAGYTDVVLTSKPDSLTLQGAREGLRREIDALKQRLHKVVEFTQTWRRAYGVVDLNQIVETAVALHAEPLRARGVTCTFLPHAGLPYTVADPMRLRQVFHSLFSFVRGALKEEGSRTEMRVRTLADAGMLRVHVDFTGRTGVAELARPLLDPNVEVATLARERSLDLPVAVSILRDHQGELEIQTLDDLGTRITVQLPVLSEAPELKPSEPDPTDTLDQVLNRVFGEPVEPPAARRAVAPRRDAMPRPDATPMETLDALEALEPIEPLPTPAAQSVATAAPVMHSPAASPLRPTAESSPVSRRDPVAPVRPPRSDSEHSAAGLDELFQPSEMWRGAPPTVAPKRVSDEPKEASRALLAQAEVEGALKLFDEAEKSVDPPRE